MANRLLDTNIVSYLLKGHPLAAHYRRHLVGHVLVVSFTTVAELYEGAKRASWGQSRWASLHALLSRMFIVQSGDLLCHRFAEVRATRRSQPISVADAWIAATALAHGIDLVAHNPTAFQSIAGLSIFTESP